MSIDNLIAELEIEELEVDVARYGLDGMFVACIGTLCASDE